MMMIMNNLDPAVAQFPHELITYGGNGAVFQHWFASTAAFVARSAAQDSQRRRVVRAGVSTTWS